MLYREKVKGAHPKLTSITERVGADGNYKLASLLPLLQRVFPFRARSLCTALFQRLFSPLLRLLGGSVGLLPLFLDPNISLFVQVLLSNSIETHLNAGRAFRTWFFVQVNPALASGVGTLDLVRAATVADDTAAAQLYVMW